MNPAFRLPGSPFWGPSPNVSCHCCKLVLCSLHEEHRGGEHLRDKVIFAPLPFAEFLRRQDVGIDFPASRAGFVAHLRVSASSPHSLRLARTGRCGCRMSAPGPHRHPMVARLCHARRIPVHPGTPTIWGREELSAIPIRHCYFPIRGGTFSMTTQA